MSFVGNNTFGTLSSAPNGHIVSCIFNYISTVLNDFSATVDENENTITNKLCITLSQRKPQEYPFFFHHQNLENEQENTSTDFAVFGVHPYSTDQPAALVKFEAKRLTKLPAKREREYVIGEYDNGNRVKNSGGIERFKNGRHGRDSKIAGLIGYIQIDSCDIWQNKINQWIRDEISSSHDTSLVWEEDDLLKFESSNNRIVTCTSLAKRLDIIPIELKHIFVNFVNK